MAIVMDHTAPPQPPLRPLIHSSTPPTRTQQQSQASFGGTTPLAVRHRHPPMLAPFRKLIVLAVAGAALLAAPALSDDGTAQWSHAYTSVDNADAYNIAVDPATGDSFVGVEYYGSLKASTLPLSGCYMHCTTVPAGEGETPNPSHQQSILFMHPPPCPTPRTPATHRHSTGWGPSPSRAKPLILRTTPRSLSVRGQGESEDDASFFLFGMDPLKPPSISLAPHDAYISAAQTVKQNAQGQIMWATQLSTTDGADMQGLRFHNGQLYCLGAWCWILTWGGRGHAPYVALVTTHSHLVQNTRFYILTQWRSMTCLFPL